MSSEEEEKKEQSDPCTKCQKPMEAAFVFSLPIELTCGHDVCVMCIIKELPHEEAELNCLVCETA